MFIAVAHSGEQGCVYCTCKDTPPVIAVKILNPSTEEVSIQKRVLREIRRPNNHTLPAEMTVTGHPLLIMPAIILVQDEPLRMWSLRHILDVVFQIIEVWCTPLAVFCN